MEKITSFMIDHEHLDVGLYVSRIDYVKDYPVTTLDIRMTRPNQDPVLSTGTIHAIEHIVATFLRNHTSAKEDILYFGPMGCRTGFYLLIQGKRSSQDCRALLQEVFTFVSSYRGEVPGASPKECGNYTDMDLEGAKKAAKQYKEQFLDQPKETQFTYPQHKR